MQIRKLNTLRGLAALIVLLDHYTFETDLFGGLLGRGSGQIGVMLFFMLSGFLMAHLYADRPFTKRNRRRYAVARIARVLPLFLLVVLLSFFLQQLQMGGIFYDIPDGAALASHLLMLSGDSVLWTIPPEVHFYLGFLLIWWLILNKPAALYGLMALATLALIILGFPDPGWEIGGVLIRAKIAQALPYFFAGILMGRLYGRWRVPAWLNHPLFVLTLLLLLLAFPRIFYALTGEFHQVWRDLRVLVIVAGVFFSVVFLIPKDNPLLANPLGDFLGRISYSLYLLHLPVLRWFSGWATTDSIWFLPGYLLLAVGIAYLSFRCIEQPAQQWIRQRFMERHQPG